MEGHFPADPIGNRKKIYVESHKYVRKGKTGKNRRPQNMKKKQFRKRNRDIGQPGRLLQSRSLVCIAVLVFLGSVNLIREFRLQQEIAAGVVRFHVKANSDDIDDQQMKLQVRNAVLKELKTILTGAETKAETEEILRQKEPAIREAAVQTLRANGSTDKVTVKYGKSYFEEKETGNYRLPAGIYDALKVNIGRAKGHNWWCMLYPSICFSDALRPVNENGETAETVENSTMPLQKLLSDAAYREILKSDRISFRSAVYQRLEEWIPFISGAFQQEKCYSSPDASER